MLIEWDKKRFVLDYTSSDFFKQTLATFLHRLHDPEEAFAHALRIFQHIGPCGSEGWEHLIPEVIGISFDFEEAGFEEDPPAISLYEFLGVVIRNPGNLWYEDDGPLHKAVKAGISAGIKAYPTWTTEPEPGIDMDGCMARLYHAMFLHDGRDELSDRKLESPFALVDQVHETFCEIFEVIDGRFYPNSNHCAMSASRAFWEFFGFSVDDQRLPIIWW